VLRSSKGHIQWSSSPSTRKNGGIFLYHRPQRLTLLPRFTSHTNLIIEHIKIIIGQYNLNQCCPAASMRLTSWFWESFYSPKCVFMRPSSLKFLARTLHILSRIRVSLSTLQQSGDLDLYSLHGCLNFKEIYAVAYRKRFMYRCVCPYVELAN
jgi:hypothetical protein